MNTRGGYGFPGKQVFRASPSMEQTIKFKVGPDSRVVLQKSIKQIPAGTSRRLKLLRRQYEGGSAVAGGGGRHHNKFLLVASGQSGNQWLKQFNKEPQVKLLDKISFTLGVWIICLSEYVIIRDPDWFPAYYQTLICILVAMRTYFYFKSKAQFFMIDFCYAVNLSCMLASKYSPEDVRWFKINFICSLGPLCAAIPLWRNSLVFHSLDKVTSFFLHGLPPTLCVLYRFGYTPNKNIKALKTLDIMSIMPDTIVLYVIWQVFYTVATEVVFKSDFERDPELMTSLRHMARDKKNPMKNVVTVLLRKIGVLKLDETLNADETKTKIVFIFVQFAYTMVTLIPCPWLFESLELSVVYMMLIFFVGSWNGASYYIDVFSKNYNRQFEQTQQQDQKIGPVQHRPQLNLVTKAVDIDSAIKELNIGSSLSVEILEKLEAVVKERERAERRNKKLKA